QCELESPFADLVENLLARSAFREPGLKIELSVPIGIGHLFDQHNDLHRHSSRCLNPNGVTADPREERDAATVKGCPARIPHLLTRLPKRRGNGSRTGGP